jgi:hypothetical protein
VEARAADDRTRESVLRTARRFAPLVVGGMDDDDAIDVSTTAGGSLDVVDDDDDVAAAAWMEERISLSNMSFAGAGITPPGNDDDNRIGSSLTGGHISDPLP